MISCKLGEKTYFVPCITMRAMRELGPAANIWAKLQMLVRSLNEGQNPGEIPDIKDILDTLTDWFCVLFGRQFPPTMCMTTIPWTASSRMWASPSRQCRR